MLLRTSFGGVRKWSEADAPALVKHANNRKIWLNLRDAFPHPYTINDARTFLRSVKMQDPTTFFAIAAGEDAIGGIGLSINRDVHRFTAELGYWLGEAYWGKGVMTESVRCFTDWAFGHFRLKRIYAEPYANNPASCKVLEKAGFVMEGRLQASVLKDKQILDQIVYALVRV